MDEKIGKILEIITNRKDSTKLDIKKLSGYSMTTVLKAVDRLAEEGFITCDIRKVKSGKPPSVINVNQKGFIVIVENGNNQCSIRLATLGGNILFQKVFDKSISQELLADISKHFENEPLFVYILSEQSVTVKDCNDFNCEIHIEKYWHAMGRVIKNKLNKNSVALLSIGESINYTYIDNNSFSLDIGKLVTSILHIEKGRLSVENVLAYQNGIDKEESDNKCFSVALSDIVNQINAFAKPDTIVIIKDKNDRRLDGLTIENCLIYNNPDKSEIAYHAAFLALYGK